MRGGCFNLCPLCRAEGFHTKECSIAASVMLKQGELAFLKAIAAFRHSLALIRRLRKNMAASKRELAVRAVAPRKPSEQFKPTAKGLDSSEPATSSEAVVRRMSTDMSGPLSGTPADTTPCYAQVDSQGVPAGLTEQDADFNLRPHGLPRLPSVAVSTLSQGHISPGEGRADNGGAGNG